jgi:site-specific DNA-methyltransferase (adenine-specific)
MTVSSDDWETPPCLMSYVRERFQVDFDLAASAENAKCDRFFTKEEDALQQSWADLNVDGDLFLNPPFSLLSEFTLKAKEESRNGAGIVIIAPAYPDRRWFQNHVIGHASYVRFFSKRIEYVLPDGRTGRPRFGTALIRFFPGDVSGTTIMKKGEIQD